MPLFLAILFVVLTPGVLLSLPPKSPLLTKAIVHSLVFALVYYLLQSTVMQYDGFTNPKGTACKTAADCASGNCENKMCA
jgi:hypothetical protein